MNEFDFKNYMTEVAIKHKDFLHTEQSPHFFIVSSIANLEGLLGQLDSASFPSIVIHDNHEGVMGDESRSQNYLDKPDFTFYVIDKVAKKNDMERQENVKRFCKLWGFQIIARMLTHKKQAERTGQDPHGIMFLEKASFPYQSIGPIGNNCYGVMFNITVPKVADLTYNSEDWSE